MTGSFVPALPNATRATHITRPRRVVSTSVRCDLDLAEAAKPRPAIPAPTLASIVQKKIVNDISDGHLPPGMRLEEEELAGRYRVSRTPVREALRQLSAIGVVDIKHRQGVVVTARSAERFNDLLEVVADLEASAARYATQRMTEFERQKLLAVHEQMRGIVERAAALHFDRVNAILHQLIHEGAHNEILFSGIMQMRLRTVPYTRVECISERRRMEISHMEHNAVVHAIMRREAELAYQAMRLHIIDAGRVMEDRAQSGPRR